MTRWFDATDPRDKVFALVGLTSDLDKSFVDYSKSYEDVMKELNIMLLDGGIEPTMGSVFDIWSLLTREEDEEITEPSWVVDLFKARYSMSTAMVTGYPSMEPEIERKPEIHFPTEDGDESLHVCGTVFDTITQTAPFPKFMSEVELRNTNDLQNISSYREWILRVGALMQRPDDTDTDGIYRATGESHYEAFWRTLCCNRTSFSAYDPPEDGSGYDAYLAHLRVLELQLGYEHTKSKAWYLGIATAFSSSLSYCFRRRNWFLRFAVPLAVPLLAHMYNIAWSKNWAVLQGQLQSHQRDFESMHMQWIQGRQFAITKMGLIGLVPISARNTVCVKKTW
ncbi:hypothetical protein J4E86_010864 [Alternaria arbusti]|uniref:uncharacterized protein n=1 Tax=Alternaria arbusti TaxID=232088 RepID=UPI002220F7EA|nr:uncharacterized protein J4E86_010864 [Alternaria arbusti]KAI4940484.1 hypothetical protein J4E86_010864 [Alternaria arbusti]